MSVRVGSIKELKERQAADQGSSANPDGLFSAGAMHRATVAEMKSQVLEEELKKEKKKRIPKEKVIRERPLSRDAAEFIMRKLTPKSSDEDKAKFNLIRKITKYYDAYNVKNTKRPDQLYKMSLASLQSELQGLESMRASGFAQTIVFVGYKWLVKGLGTLVEEITSNEELGFDEPVDMSLLAEIVEDAVENDEDLRGDLVEFAIKYSGWLEVCVELRLVFRSAKMLAEAHQLAKTKKRANAIRRAGNIKLKNAAAFMGGKGKEHN